MGLPLKDHQHHNYRDYLGWPDDVRYELIDGEAYCMAPAPDLVHQDVAGGLYRQLGNALEGRACRVFIAPVDVRLPRAGEADDAVDTVVQPDVLVVCNPDKLDRRGVRGAPDWIAEVLSPSTASHDQIAKRRVYERAGVAEYWLIHPTDRVLTIYRLDGAEYGKPDICELAGVTPVGVLPGVVIDWGALVARLPQPD